MGMVSDAEKFRSEDEKQRECVSSKNALESYCFNMKSTVEDEKFKDKLSDADKTTILDKCNEIIKWLDANQLAEKEEFEHKQKEIERVCNPIVTRLYQGAGGAPPGFPVPAVPPPELVVPLVPVQDQPLKRSTNNFLLLPTLPDLSNVSPI